MRTLLHLPLEIATAFFFTASIAVSAGAMATSYTHRLGDGLRMALVAFLIAGAAFGYAIWRNYRPGRKPAGRRFSPADLTVPR